MEVLVLGGTRFVGRALAERLLSEGRNVTVVSRRPDGAPKGARIVEGERGEGLKRLENKRFDTTIDFICPDGDSLEIVHATLDPGTYILISSTWLPRLDIPEAPLLDVTRRYLEGKRRAEKAVARLRKQGKAASAIRLPIMWGTGDRTGRLEYYRRRLREKRPLIVVDGGTNKVQIAWGKDIARVIAAWLEKGLSGDHLLWEALPDEGVPVMDVITHIAATEGVSPNLVEISHHELARDIPDFLITEPLWRETPVPMTPANLFEVAGLKPTPQTTWLTDLARLPLNVSEKHYFDAEQAYLEGRGHA